MDNTKVKTSFSNIIHNGIVGLFSGSVLFIPSYLLTSYLLQYIFFEVLHKPHYSNTDDILLIYFFCPIALVVSLILGILGGAWGNRTKHTERGATLGSIIGGCIGGALIAVLMAYVIVSWWATYYD